MIDSFRLFIGRQPIFYFVFAIFLAFLVGLVFGNYFFGNSRDNNCLSEFKFINPEPGCEAFDDRAGKMESLQSTLELDVKKYLDEGKAKRISVFTRDLVSKRFAGVNDTDIFFMASLLKVPLAIAYFRLSEITPDILFQEIVYTRKPDLYISQGMQPPERLIAGKNYSVNNLLYRALAYSDNTAAEILSGNFVSYDYLQKILNAIGLQAQKNGEAEDLVTAKSYAGVFRILYNSSFLTRKSSNEILGVLSKSTFTNGAILSLPKDVVVAHKFGERTVLNASTKNVVERQLHDCGIVYAQKGKEPYTFCILTEGKNFSDLEEIIRDISRTIYVSIAE